MTSASPDGSEWRFPNRATPLGSPPYYAVRFSPAAERERNALLIAWYEVIQAIADQPHDPGVARLKLDWWRQEIDQLAAGRARHPLAKLMHEQGIGGPATAPMYAIIDAAEDQMRTPTPIGDDEFAAACRATLGRFFVLLAQLEPDAGYLTSRCVEAGAFCAAVERIRQLTLQPHRVPGDLTPQTVNALSKRQRQRRLDLLLDRFPAVRTDVRRLEIPDLARRLTALAGALQRKMRRKGYPVGDTLIDRAPIAHLWTAWRCH
jgi:phytoene synthase